ncbi:hypothetical protein [Halanaeroarchaeum sp. HSR-CO]|uniref:hypothetical protein n=1 Tax=Halanaeroarchaeum sp. HSR-CO TaxID=2866382 RepID=UPI00217E4994|nr:hypothetical protein [Halanaeroarchaeum sp. HSR-CO]
MSDEHSGAGMHLDVLLEDQYSKFVADGLEPDIVVGAFKDKINLGIDARDGSVDVFLGNLSTEDARDLAAALTAAADAVESSTVEGGGQSWTISSDTDRS